MGMEMGRGAKGMAIGMEMGRVAKGMAMGTILC